MKSTKIMLAVLATILITWCVMGTIVYLLSDDTFKECMTHEGTIFLMLLIGWIPGVILGADLNETLE